jgi:hypothetical protein
MQAEAVSHDALLQASRRVDWRFLLPRPELGRVACMGETDPELVRSLRLFSSELTASQSAGANEREASHDLVVLRNASLDELDAARLQLQPGGWLYVEVERPGRRKRARAARSARGYARALRKLGLVDVNAYVHWPDFASCRAIVPLEDAVAVRYGLERGRVNGARFMTRFAPVLAVTHQLAHFVPCTSVLGQLPSSGAEGTR